MNVTFICNTKTNPSSRNLFREAHNKNMNFYYDENRIFPKEAILNQKQELCVRRKMPFTEIWDLFSFQRYSRF